jgi:putative pyruvate formate lyase activating enzyme
MRGRCGETAVLRLAAAALHHGEEPPLIGTGGSGTIFVSGCNLGCIFCQNRQISHDGMGRAVSTEEFVSICRMLHDARAENINIVTGSHAVPALVAGIQAVAAAAIPLPVLWNSSAYESSAALEMLAGLVDGYLPDLKTLDSALAARFFSAPDYPSVAVSALEQMMQQTRTVIIRHLVLPGLLDSTYTVLRWFAERAAGKAVLSLMMQYTPVDAGGRGAPDRMVNDYEYETVLGWLDEFGIDEGFYQELQTDSDWLPDFSKPNPFSAHLSKPVWHWRTGMVRDGSEV